MTFRPSYLMLGSVLLFGAVATPLSAQPGNLMNPAALN